jgi:hypothetical protein
MAVLQNNGLNGVVLVLLALMVAWWVFRFVFRWAARLSPRVPGDPGRRVDRRRGQQLARPPAYHQASTGGTTIHRMSRARGREASWDHGDHETQAKPSRANPEELSQTSADTGDPAIVTRTSQSASWCLTHGNLHPMEGHRHWAQAPGSRLPLDSGRHDPKRRSPHMK